MQDQTAKVSFQSFQRKLDAGFWGLIKATCAFLKAETKYLILSGLIFGLLRFPDHLRLDNLR